jgi:hypothetical protein
MRFADSTVSGSTRERVLQRLLRVQALRCAVPFVVMFGGSTVGLCLGRQPAQELGIMENGTMSRMLHFGDTQIEDTRLADLCPR